MMSIASPLALHRFPRFSLLEGATPIQPLARLNRQFGGVEVFVKRDDLNWLGGGGNKLRKLEFLVGEAIAQDADTIITVGARQSNHARLTAAAAARAGLKCELVLTRLVPRYDDDYLENGNIVLNGLFGAHVHDLPGDANALAFAEERATALRAEGRKVYVCPLGGSSPAGCLGYADCAAEIVAQSEQMGVPFDYIVGPNGSGGMHAGLVAGMIALGRTTPDKANQTIRLIDPTLSVPSEAVVVDGSQLGDGYGIPTEAMLRAVRLLASTEGLLLDPVYSGKAFAGLLQGIETGAYRAGQRLLFVMTGGLPGLYAYRSAFEGSR
jgi:L-cysteate sulfo-lyase